RLARMSRDEMVFRVAGAARHGVERAAFALRRPRWVRRSLSTALDPDAGPLVREAIEALRRGRVLAAHRALGRHFATRRQRWPLHASDRAPLAADIVSRFPAAAFDAAHRADRIRDGRQD